MEKKKSSRIRFAGRKQLSRIFSPLKVSRNRKIVSV